MTNMQLFFALDPMAKEELAVLIAIRMQFHELHMEGNNSVMDAWRTCFHGALAAPMPNNMARFRAWLAEEPPGSLRDPEEPAQ